MVDDSKKDINTKNKTSISKMQWARRDKNRIENFVDNVFP